VHWKQNETPLQFRVPSIAFVHTAEDDYSGFPFVNNMTNGTWDADSTSDVGVAQPSTSGETPEPHPLTSFFRGLRFSSYRQATFDAGNGTYMFALVQRNLFQGRLAGPGTNVPVAELWIRDSECHPSCGTCLGPSSLGCLTCAVSERTPVNGSCSVPLKFASASQPTSSGGVDPLAVGLIVGLGGGALILLIIVLLIRRSRSAMEGDYSVSTVEAYVENRVGELDVTPPHNDLTMDELFDHRQNSPSTFSPAPLQGSRDSLQYFFEPNELSTPRFGRVLLRTPTEFGVRRGASSDRDGASSRASSAPSPSPSKASMITL
jgi:hypothetical protein